MVLLIFIFSPPCELRLLCPLFSTVSMDKQSYRSVCNWLSIWCSISDRFTSLTPRRRDSHHRRWLHLFGMIHRFANTTIVFQCFVTVMSWCCFSVWSLLLKPFRLAPSAKSKLPSYPAASEREPKNETLLNSIFSDWFCCIRYSWELPGHLHNSERSARQNSSAGHPQDSPTDSDELPQKDSFAGFQSWYIYSRSLKTNIRNEKLLPDPRRWELETLKLRMMRMRGIFRLIRQRMSTSVLATERRPSVRLRRWDLYKLCEKDDSLTICVIRELIHPNVWWWWWWVPLTWDVIHPWFLPPDCTRDSAVASSIFDVHTIHEHCWISFWNAVPLTEELIDIGRCVIIEARHGEAGRSSGDRCGQRNESRSSFLNAEPILLRNILIREMVTKAIWWAHNERQQTLTDAPSRPSYYAERCPTKFNDGFC